MLRLDRRTISFVRGAFDFTGIHSGTAPGVAGNERGQLAWADFLLDEPQQVRLGFTASCRREQIPARFPAHALLALAHLRQRRYPKLTPRLTMNIGDPVRIQFRHRRTSAVNRAISISRKQDLFPAALTRAAQRSEQKAVCAAYRLCVASVRRQHHGDPHRLRHLLQRQHDEHVRAGPGRQPAEQLNINELNSAGVVRIRMRDRRPGGGP